MDKNIQAKLDIAKEIAQKISNCEVRPYFTYEYGRKKDSSGISVFVDRKTIENNWKDDPYTLRYKGAGFGVNGYHPINQNWLLIGSIGFMSLNIKADSESIGDGSGGSLSIGALYRINPRANFSIRLKSQHNEFEFDQGSKQEHDIGGLVLGFSYGL